MTSELRMVFRLAWRWSLASTLALTGFWSMWYAINGDVPSEHLTRWADIAIGPIWSVLAVVGRLVFAKDEQLAGVLAIVWGLSLLCALSMGLVTGFIVMGNILVVLIVITLLSVVFWLLLLGWSLLPGSKTVSRWLSGN